jgi:hypothetical protein
MRAYPLLGEVGGGWALEFPSLFGQGCWRDEGSLDRGVDRGRSLGLDEPFFLILARPGTRIQISQKLELDLAE